MLMAQTNDPRPIPSVKARVNADADAVANACCE